MGLYIKEYLLPLWYFSIAIIILLVGIYCFLYRIFVARKFQDKKRIKERSFRFLNFFLLPVILILLALNNNNNFNMFLAIILLGSGFYCYDYDFILDEGLLINGKFIPWNKIHSWDYKNNKDILILKYFKNDNKLSKVKFNIISNLRFEFETILKDNVNNKSVGNENKVYSNKNIKLGLSLSLLLITIFSVYGFYILVQPKNLGEILEESFNHKETSYAIVHYEKDLTKFDISIASKLDKVKKLTTYLNSFHIRKIRYKDLKYNYSNRDLYKIELAESNGDKVEIFISNKEPIIEIIRDTKKKSYFIDTQCNYSEFLNKFIQSTK